MGKRYEKWKTLCDRLEAEYRKLLREQRKLDAQASPDAAKVRAVEKQLDRAYNKWSSTKSDPPPKES